MKKTILLNILPVLSFAGLYSSAHADGTWINCNRTDGYYQFFDSGSVQAGKDAEVGDVLGDWFTSANPTAWTCSHRKAYENATVPITVQGYPPYTTEGTVSVDGATYTIYNAVGKAGLGYITRWRFTAKGQTSNWYPLTIKTGGQQTPAEFLNISHDANNPQWSFGVDVQTRFVKTSDKLTSGRIPLFDPIYVRHYQNYNGKDDAGTLTYMIAQFRSGQVGIETGGTCTTSDANVTLPPVSRSKFIGIGSTAARASFDLNLTKCPAGLASINYLFTPTTSIIDNSNGVFALDKSSTASGVGLQLLNNQDSPLNFNTKYHFSDYNSSVDNANYKIPLRVGIYQTENNVNPGSISGAVTFTLSYK